MVSNTSPTATENQTLPTDGKTTIPIEVEKKNDENAPLNRHAYLRLLSRMKKAKKKELLENIKKAEEANKKDKRKKRNKIAKKSRKQNRKK